MNLFSKRNVCVNIISTTVLSLAIIVSVLSIFPSVSMAAVQVGDPTPGNGLWTRVTQFFSPYNDGQHVYTPNTYGGAGYSNGGGSYTRAPKNFYELIVNTIIGGMLRPIVSLLVSAAILVFLWGVFKFIRSDGKEKETGKQFMVWGLVGIFVMVSVWGLVNILQGTFNLNDTQINVNNILLK